MVKGKNTLHSAVTVNFSFNTFIIDIFPNSAWLSHLNLNSRCLIVLLIGFISASSSSRWINQPHWDNSDQNSMTPANEHSAPAKGCHKYNGSLPINKSSLSHFDQCRVLTWTCLMQRGRRQAWRRSSTKITISSLPAKK